MDRLTRERLLLSFLLATLFHILLAIPLSLIDWKKVDESARMKPVVLLELSDPVEVPLEPKVIDEPEPEPEPLPEPVPEPTLSEEAPAGDVAPVEPVPQDPPPPATAPAAQEPRSTASEGSPSAGSASPLDSRSTDTPASPPRRVTARESAELPPLPEEERSSTGSSGVIYADEPEPDPGVDEGTQEPSPVQESAPEEESQLLSEGELSERLENISDRRNREGSAEGDVSGGNAISGNGGDVDGPGVTGGTAADSAVSKDQVKDITFTSGERRVLLQAPKIRIPQEIVSSLAGLRTINMEIAFTLAPDGTLISPRILTSTGSLELETVVKNGLRSWRFSRTNETVTSQDEGTIHLEIRIR